MIRPESVAVVAELSFTNRFHYLLDTLLNKPVPYTRDTQGPCLAGVIWLRYLLAPYWFGAIPMFASIYNKSYFFDHFIGGTFSDVLDCEVVCSACLTSCILLDISVRKQNIFSLKYNGH